MSIERVSISLSLAASTSVLERNLGGPGREIARSAFRKPKIMSGSACSKIYHQVHDG
jgi:hypothetical protein